MITMSKFGTHGRLGNQLFQWQFLDAMAKILNTELVLPKWKYADYFKNPPKQGNITGKVITEPHYQFNWQPYAHLTGQENYDFVGYWQHDEYAAPDFNISFKDEYRERIRDKFFYELSKPTIAIGVRRTDYTKKPLVYYQIPVHYYISALNNYFPEWRDCNLIFITDDRDYCKMHFGCLPNAMFPDVEDIDAMCLMSLCDNIIMGNSTFYYWAGKLGNAKKIIQPTRLFDGKLLEEYGDINFFYPDDGGRWKQHNECKIDLRDVTFTIPVYFDHPDRKTNLERCVFQLQQYFNTNIIVGEQKQLQFQYMRHYGQYMHFDYDTFHRTRMLNEMAKAATTPIIANWDADVVVPPMQIFETVCRIREGREMVYPYAGIFHRIVKKNHDRMNGDIGVYASDTPNGRTSFGGAVMWNRDSFLRIGGENEYMISFAPEDVERMERATKLELRIDRVPGNLYHFDHWVGDNSTTNNPHFRENRRLLHQQRTMDKQELLEYIQSWPWHSPYTASYYETITEDAIRSRDEIFRILGIGPDATIIDCGCGVGQWGVGVKYYDGIDWQVPKDKLLINPVNYYEHDLRTELSVRTRYDYCLCLEVAEHVEEKYADTLIDTLCRLSDTIIFSAAIPFQGGNNHVNEQWQSYWAKKFEERDYYGIYNDEVRLNEKVCYWYRQNLIIYKKIPTVANVSWVDTERFNFVLPEYYEQIVKHLAAK